MSPYSGNLAITITDARQKSRQTARAWSFSWYHVKFVDDKLTDKALTNLPREVQDRYALIVSRIKATDSDWNPLSLWVPHCYLPYSMQLHFHQQLGSRRKYSEVSTESDRSDPDLTEVLNIAESSTMGSRRHDIVTHFVQRPKSRSSPANNLGFLDLTNHDSECYNGQGSETDPILLLE